MILRKILASVCFLASALVAAGQEAAERRDFNFRTETDPVMFLSNPAAVSQFNGGLASLTESPDAYKAGALTESYISISPKISFHGKLAWSYFSGQDMGGPILMEPDFNPVNFLESSEATTGQKNREGYSLLGAMSYRFNEKWSSGVSFEYESADQTKVKDPRFSNILMDMRIRAGVVFTPSERLLLGASLVYRNAMEKVRGGIYGTTDKQYFIYTDKGGFYGTMFELSGDYNPIPMTEFKPMKNDFYGLSLQAISGIFSNELEVLYRDGFYGKKASSSATFFEFSGVRAAYRADLTAPAGADLHHATLKLDYELLGNNENVFKYVTPSGQNTRVEYSGQNHILDRNSIDAELGYVFYKGMGGYLPDFSAGITAKGRARFLSTVIYPYYRNSDVITMTADAFAQKNFFSGKSVFSLDLGAGFRTGFGTPKEDGSYASTSGSNLKSFDNYLYRQFEFDTASAAGGSLGFTYTYLFSDRFALYIKLSDDFSALLAEPQYLGGRIRNVALATVGCNF